MIITRDSIFKVNIDYLFVNITEFTYDIIVQCHKNQFIIAMLKNAM